MKSNMNMRIIKLAIAEIVLQSGFERISEQALNILSDVFRHYLEQVSLRLKHMGNIHSSFECTSKALINDFISEDSYQEVELNNFLRTQLLQKKSLGDKTSDESILHTLKVIPKSVDLTNVCINTNNFSLVPSLKNDNSNISLEIDPVMDEFITGCLSETKRGEKAGEYKYNLIEIVSEDIQHNYVMKTKKLIDPNCNTILNDFDYLEKRKVFKEKFN